jgi:hypothetical protein
MAKLLPSLRSTDTYTETNFLFLHSLKGTDTRRKVTLEHFCRASGHGNAPGWSCLTIIDAEVMTRDDAVFIAQSYASRNDIPVIYESHTD